MPLWFASTRPPAKRHRLLRSLCWASFAQWLRADHCSSPLTTYSGSTPTRITSCPLHCGVCDRSALDCSRLCGPTDCTVWTTIHSSCFRRSAQRITLGPLSIAELHHVLQPLLATPLVLEDLHDADRDTLDLLVYLARHQSKSFSEERAYDLVLANPPFKGATVKRGAVPGNVLNRISTGPAQPRTTTAHRILPLALRARAPNQGALTGHEQPVLGGPGDGNGTFAPPVAAGGSHPARRVCGAGRHVQPAHHCSVACGMCRTRYS